MELTKEKMLEIAERKEKCIKCEKQSCFNCENFVCANKVWREEVAFYEQVKELLQADADGRLVVLPCKVGDTVYQIMITGIYKDLKKLKYEIFEAKVLKFSIDTYKVCFWTKTLDEEKYENELIINAFGETVFLTREESEAALEKMDGE